MTTVIFAIAAVFTAGVIAVAASRGPSRLAWVSLRFGRDLDAAEVVGFVRSLAGDRTAPIGFEIHGVAGTVGFFVGARPGHIDGVVSRLQAFCPTVTATPVVGPSRDAVRVWSVRVSSRLRPLRAEADGAMSRAVLDAIASTRDGESAVVQVVLGARLAPKAVPTRLEALPASTMRNALDVLGGRRGPVDSDARRAWRDKTAEPGFRLDVRVAVVAASRERTFALAGRVAAALRVAEAPGVRLGLRRTSTRGFVEARATRRGSLAANVVEVAWALLGWPVGDGAYPMLDRSGPRLLAPTASVPADGRIVATATFPGRERPLALNPPDSMSHMMIIGPTGTGKTHLINSLIFHDMCAGFGAVVVDVKGDMAATLAAIAPAGRLDDIVIIDAADALAGGAGRVVGFNPLAANGRPAEVVADQTVADIRHLYDSWGPRMADVISAAALTMAGRGDATLPAMVVLLTNAAYRRQVLAGIADPIALSPFWAWFDALSDAERAKVLEPVLSRLRALVMRPHMRAILGQASPAFSIRQVFTERKILIVSIPKSVGPDTAKLLGSMIVTAVWNATLERASIAPAKRHPVHLYVDEVQDLLHANADLADALVQARSLGLGIVTANQNLAQLPRKFLRVLQANARSKVCFQLASDDAAVVAKWAPELDAADIAALGRYEIYASLTARGTVTAFASAKTIPLPEALRDPAVVYTASRRRWGRDVAAVDAEISALADTGSRGGALGDVGQRRRR